MAVFALGSALLAAPAMAQDARDLDGADGDIRVFTGSVADEPARYLLTLPAGNALVVSAVAAPDSPLDPYLRVTDVRTGEVLAEDDDNAREYGARVYLFSDGQRRVEIQVSAEGAVDAERERGDFELAVQPTDWRPAPVRRVDFGSSVTGDLHSGERHVFRIEAKAGQLLTAVLRPAQDSALDPYLELRRGSATAGNALAEDDDGAGSLGARLRYVVREAGTYTLVASTVGGTAGTYRLEIGDGTGRAAAVPEQVISLDQPVSGELRSSDPDGGDMQRIVYRFSDEATAALRDNPGPLVIRMRRQGDENALDPLVELSFETPLGLAAVASDDDGGGDLDSELVVDLSPLASQPDQIDRLRIVARSIADAAEGAFTLEVTRE
jgi:hypothetical protein